MRTTTIWGLLVALTCSACGGESSNEPAEDPGHIAVDHILIGARNPRNPRGRYDVEEARALAYDLLAQLKAGADWDALKRKHSEDPPPGGPYEMADNGVQPRHRKEYKRSGMVPAFGDVGFTLKVGEIGIADFSPTKSWYGFHIIKRVK